MINARSDDMYSAAGFIRNMGMLSYPVEQSLRKLFIIFRTSSELFVCGSNSSVVLFSGSDVIARQMSEVFTGYLSVTRSAVLLKSLLISFTFLSKVVLFGFRMW